MCLSQHDDLSNTRLGCPDLNPHARNTSNAAVYVDQATRLGFNWLQKSVDVQHTMEGKLAFEQFCQLHGIQVRHYHANNGIFASNTWSLSCQDQSQGLSFAGVGTHIIVKLRIQELQK